MNRFDYVKYDEKATDIQALAKDLCVRLEATIEANIKSGRAKASALTALEVCYMWIGKGIRDDQVVRNEGEIELQEGRNNS